MKQGKETVNTRRPTLPAQEQKEEEDIQYDGE
jgi:hypothetical protein